MNDEGKNRTLQMEKCRISVGIRSACAGASRCNYCADLDLPKSFICRDDEPFTHSENRRGSPMLQASLFASSTSLRVVCTCSG